MEIVTALCVYAPLSLNLLIAIKEQLHHRLMHVEIFQSKVMPKDNYHTLRRQRTTSACMQ